MPKRLCIDQAQDRLRICIPASFHIKSIVSIKLHNTAKNIGQLIYVFLLFWIYAMPIHTTYLSITEGLSWDSFASAILTCTLYPLILFKAFSPNGMTILKINPVDYELQRKVHFISWTVKGKTTDIEAIQFCDFPISLAEIELAKQCSLIVNGNRQMLGRALELKEPKQLQLAISQFLDLAM